MDTTSSQYTKQIETTPFSQAEPSDLWGHHQGGGGGGWQGEALHVVLSLPFSVPISFFLTGCAVWVKAPSQKWEKLLSKVQPLSSWNLENGHWRGRSKLGTKDGGGTLATAVVVRGFTGAPFIKKQLVVSGSWVRAEEKPGRLRRGNGGLCLHPKKVKRIYMCEESCFEHPQ